MNINNNKRQGSQTTNADAAKQIIKLESENMWLLLWVSLVTFICTCSLFILFFTIRFLFVLLLGGWGGLLVGGRAAGREEETLKISTDFFRQKVTYENNIETHAKKAKRRDPNIQQERARKRKRKTRNEIKAKSGNRAYRTVVFLMGVCMSVGNPKQSQGPLARTRSPFRSLFRHAD